LPKESPERKKLTSTFRNDIRYYKNIIEKMEENALEASHGIGNKEVKDRNERQ